MKRNYQLEMEEEISRLNGRRPTLLLHSCCGPCSSAVLERLTEHFQVTVLYYNPNIEPEEEYLHRLSEQERLLSLLPGNVKLLPCAYDHAAFSAFAEGMADCPEGGERCLKCFALRLKKTAREAAGREAGVKYLMADFKKKNGYLRSLQLSKEYGLYRQDYCGCLYSKPEKA